MTRPNPSRLYCLIFGSFPALSAAEVEAVIAGFPRPSGERVTVMGMTTAAAFFETLSDDVAKELFRRLGGAVRLVRVVVQDVALNTVPTHLQKMTSDIVSTRPVFGITVVGGSITPSMIQRWGLEVKQWLYAQSRLSRFVFDKSATLSAAQVKKNQMLKKGAEFVVLHGDSGTWSIGTTIAIQDVDEWSERDIKRPRRNARRGMLPPKIARIMVNLAVQPQQQKAISNTLTAYDLPLTTILDPFCGSGTILMEALQLGYSVIGSDISAKAVEDTKANLEWLSLHCHSGLRAGIQRSTMDPRVKPEDDKHWKLFVFDVRQLSSKLPHHSIDAIVTEPDLGPPQSRFLRSENEIETIRRRLEQLYFDSLFQFFQLLKPGGRVAMSLPIWRLPSPRPAASGERVRVRGNGDTFVFSIKDLTTVERAGFKIVDPISRKRYPQLYTLNSRLSLLYGRPDQFVWREILILQKNFLAPPQAGRDCSLRCSERAEVRGEKTAY